MQERAPYVKVMAAMQEILPDARFAASPMSATASMVVLLIDCGCDKPVDRFTDDQGTDRDEEKTVYYRSRDLDPVVTKGLCRCRQPFCNDHGTKRKDECNGILEHMGCIAKERERAGEDAADHFCHEDNCGKNNRKLQRFFVCVGMYGFVLVIVDIHEDPA